MRELGLQVRSRKGKKFTTYRGTIGHIAPNRLERDFTATGPNQKWVTDITEFKAKDGGKVYLSPTLDLFNNEIVAFNLNNSPNWAQVESMLKMAIKRQNKTKEEIVEAVRDYLDYYNHRRIQLKLKGLSPIQYCCQSLN